MMRNHKKMVKNSSKQKREKIKIHLKVNDKERKYLKKSHSEYDKAHKTIQKADKISKMSQNLYVGEKRYVVIKEQDITS